MAVDRQLRALLPQVIHGPLADRFARTARRRHLEADPGRPEVDLRDAHAQWSRRRFRAVDIGDPRVGARDLRAALRAAAAHSSAAATRITLWRRAVARRSSLTQT